MAYGPLVAWLRSPAITARLGRLDRAHLAAIGPVAAGPHPVSAPPPSCRRPDPTPSSGGGCSKPPLRPSTRREDRCCSSPMISNGATRRPFSSSTTSSRIEPRFPLLVAATARREEIDPQHPVNALIAGLHALERFTEIEVGRLTRDETVMLAEQLADHQIEEVAAERLFRETEGNPLFVVEALRAGWSSHGEPRADQPEGAGRYRGSPRAAVRASPGSGRPRRDDRPRVHAGLSWRMPATPARRRWFAAWTSSGDAVSSASRAPTPTISATTRFARSPTSPSAPPGGGTTTPRRSRELERLHAADLDAVSSQIAAHWERAGQLDQAIAWYQPGGGSRPEGARQRRGGPPARPRARSPPHAAGDCRARAPGDGYPRRAAGGARYGRRVRLAPPGRRAPARARARLDARHRAAAATPPLAGDRQLDPERFRAGAMVRPATARARRAQRGRRASGGERLRARHRRLLAGPARSAPAGTSRPPWSATVPNTGARTCSITGSIPKSSASAASATPSGSWDIPRRQRGRGMPRWRSPRRSRTRSAKATALVFASMLALDLRDPERVREYAAALIGGARGAGGMPDAGPRRGPRRLQRRRRRPDSGGDRPHPASARRDARRRPCPRPSRQLDALCCSRLAPWRGTPGPGSPPPRARSALDVTLWEAEARRLRAEFLVALGAPQDEIEAELERALQTARRQGARALELRAATSLLRSAPASRRRAGCARGACRLADDSRRNARGTRHPRCPRGRIAARLN